MMEKAEKLHPELLRYLEHMDETFTMIRHPLVFSVPFFNHPMEIGRLNKMFDYKKKAIAQAKADKNYQSFVFLHERPHRLQAFQEIHRHLKDEAYWALLGQVYVDSENIHQNLKMWHLFLGSSRKQRQMIMDQDERKYFDNLPEKITIWRGCSHIDQEVECFAWTLNKEKAWWFADRWKERNDSFPSVYETTIYKHKTIAYFSGRGEDEIVVEPHRLGKIVKLPR